MCPGMMGTPGYTAFEGMFSEPVRGATGHDVVAIAMVLVGVCLDKSRRSPNLLTQPVRGMQQYNRMGGVPCVYTLRPAAVCRLALLCGCSWLLSMF